MKKTRFILGVIAAIAAAAMTGCQLELNNTEDRVSVGGYAVKSIEISGGTKSFVIGTAFTKGDLKVVAHSYDPAEAEAGVEVTDYTVSIADSIAEGTKFDKLGTKEVVVTYKGFKAKYSVEVTNAVDSIAVNSSAAKTKFYTYKGVGSDFTSDGIKVTATYSDKTTREIKITEYTVDSSAFKSTQAGTYTITVKYSDTITATYDVEVTEVTEATLVTKNAGWTGSVNSTEWWTDMGGTADAKVEAGSVVSSKFTVNSATTNNFAQLPCVVLRSEDGDGAGTEYVVVRGDNYGWGGSYEGCELFSDWNWDEFISWTNGATCTVSVINWGNGTAEVRYDLEKGGTKHFQYYKNIAVNADVFFRLKGDAGTSITFAE